MSTIPIEVHIQYPSCTVVLSVPGLYGNASQLAARLRHEGLAAKKQGELVVVNGSAEFKR